MSRKAANALRRAHPAMATAVDMVVAKSGLAKLEPRDISPYEALTRAIIFQQLSGKAASTIHSRYVALFGDEGAPAPKKVLRASEEKLRTAGVSRNKALALKDLAARTLEGSVPSLEECAALDDAELIARLVAVRGVGVWTVQMFLLFTLARPDVWPSADLGVRKGWALASGVEEMLPPKALDEVGAAFSPWRSYAALYLWRTADGGVAP